ncbi:hypothetical protein TNCV_3961731 [Trichonephila clavipes]|nr:hypothetical protein TNCV_3961731 [Trichonephila clavipes]
MPQNLLEHVSASYLLLRLTSHLGGRRRISVHAASPPWSLSFFLAPTAWRLTGSAIWRRGSVTTYWGSASRGRRKKKSLVGVLHQRRRKRQSFSRQ